MGNFGPRGSLAQVLPDGRWPIFVYASVVNCVNLLVCMFGSKLFGRTSAIVLSIVVACSGVAVVSFFADDVIHESFVYNASAPNCAPPKDNTSMANCTMVANGTFVGFAATDATNFEMIFGANLWPKFSFDCSTTHEVSELSTAHSRGTQIEIYPAPLRLHLLTSLTWLIFLTAIQKSYQLS